MRKHQANAFHRYREIHETVLERFRNEGFIRSDTLAFRPPSNGYIKLSGTIECAAWIYIVVDKNLSIVKGSGPTASVETETYSYNVVLEGEGNILRYDGPHEHRPYHHVHRFDPLETERASIAALHGDERPTLGEVIDEARGWMEGHIDEITLRRLGKS
jgi:hypothetical protein